MAPVLLLLAACATEQRPLPRTDSHKVDLAAVEALFAAQDEPAR